MSDSYRWMESTSMSQPGTASKDDVIAWLRAENKRLMEVLIECRALFADGHAISRFNWSESFLRAQDIRELNELPGKIDAAMKETR